MNFPHVSVDDATAAGAGLTGAVGGVAFAANQIPIPDGVPGWLVWVVVTLGPAFAWFFLKISHAFIAYARRRAMAKREQIKLLESDSCDANNHAIPALIESEAKWLAIADALDASNKDDKKS